MTPQSLPPAAAADVYTIGIYGIYLVVSVSFVVWVARTLKRHGRIFLVDACHGSEGLADSINHLLVVGFYLLNIGFVSLVLTLVDRPHDAVSAMEALSTKEGRVLMVLGAIHLLYTWILARGRRQGLLESVPPPVPPDGKLAPAA